MPSHTSSFFSFVAVYIALNSIISNTIQLSAHVEDIQPLFSRRVKTIFYICFGLVLLLILGGVGYHYYNKYIIGRNKKRFY